MIYFTISASFQPEEANSCDYVIKWLRELVTSEMPDAGTKFAISETSVTLPYFVDRDFIHCGRYLYHHSLASLGTFGHGPSNTAARSNDGRMLKRLSLWNPPNKMIAKTLHVCRTFPSRTGLRIFNLKDNSMSMRMNSFKKVPCKRCKQSSVKQFFLFGLSFVRRRCSF